MWSKPWSYKEGLTIGAGLLVIGILLQMTVGAINWDLFACPVNVIVLVVYIIALIAMHLLRKRVYLFGWLSHYSAAVSALLWVVGMTVIMGLIRQSPSGHASNASTDLLGFSQMISSWPFVLLYFWMVTALGLTILRASFPFKLSRLSFLLNHIGLFIALIAATLGNADMQRLKMTTRLRAFPGCKSSDSPTTQCNYGKQYKIVPTHALSSSFLFCAFTNRQRAPAIIIIIPV